MNAEPDDFLQFAQWQIRKVMGSPMISYFIDLHKQDPDRSVEEEDIVFIYLTGCAKESHAILAERVCFGTDSAGLSWGNSDLPVYFSFSQCPLCL